VTTQRFTKRQAQVIGIYTGITASNFGIVQEYAEELMGRPLWTHEMPALADELAKRAKSEFLAMCYEGEN
jgi:hypothetical protein